MKRRVLVCGDRRWTDIEIIKRDLESIEIEILVDGAANGADNIAHTIGEVDLNLPPEQMQRFHANWAEHHRAAGPIRNRKMLAFLLQAPSDVLPLVLAYHRNLMASIGTADMVSIALAAKLEVRIFPEQIFDVVVWKKQKAKRKSK